MSTKQDLRLRRRQRLRYQIRQKSHGRARLSVFRSEQNIYAQVIDDEKGHTVAAASSLDGVVAICCADAPTEKCKKMQVFDKLCFSTRTQTKVCATDPVNLLPTAN